MLRSMYSGISGMKNFQTKLDVIGNNIANVNTFGFKKGRTTFKDLVSQQIAGATGPTDGGKGGVNPRQVGLGMQLASIDTIDTQGSLQNTGRALDIGISGDGYFVVSDGENQYYTRAGNFYIDEEGYLVNSDGLYLLAQNRIGNLGDDENDSKEFTSPSDAADGYITNPNGESGEVNEGRIRLFEVDDNGEITPDSQIQSYSIGENGIINIVLSGDDTAYEIGAIQLAKFANTGGLEKVGNNLYIPSANSGGATITTPGIDGAGDLVSGTLEMSNVDLSEEFTEMIVAQRGFQANTKIITTSDEILQELVNLKR